MAELEKINIYKCPRGHQMITKDTNLPDSEERATTPMFIQCDHIQQEKNAKFDEGHRCAQRAVSSGYKVDQELEPTHEWFWPKDVAEYREACESAYGKEQADMLTEEDYKLMIKQSKTPMYRKIKQD